MMREDIQAIIATTTWLASAHLALVRCKAADELPDAIRAAAEASEAADAVSQLASGFFLAGCYRAASEAHAWAAQAWDHVEAIRGGES